MKQVFLILLGLLLLSAPAWGAENQYNFDVVVYGGTCAAVTAAEQVKIMGKTVVIVSPDKHLGGLSSGGLGATDSGNRSVIGGLSRDFYHRLWLQYQKESSWTLQTMPRENGIPGQGGRGIDNDTETMWVFEPHVAEAVFDGIVTEFGIPVYREEWLDREKGVKKDGATILSITTLSGKTFSGKRFVDATYEGDLMAAAGVTYTVGREANDAYGESLNGIQAGHAVSHQFEGFVDPYVEKGNPASGLIPTVNPEPIGVDGSADHKVQAYNLRMCLTDLPENRVPFPKPADYDEKRFEVLFRSIEAGQTIFTNYSPMPNRKTDSNNNKAVSTDYIGGNWDYPDASYERRREIYAEHLSWTKGLFWTLANHPRVPEKIREEFNHWGLAKDEFVEYGHFSPQMYIRESRRMIGDFIVSERHLRRVIETPQPVGMGSYQMDSHNIQRYVAVWEDGRKTVRNEGDVQVNPGGPYPIDFGALLPKKAECDNLLDPVTVSCSHIAYGSIRMEPVFMLLGQSAATAAVLSLDSECAVQDVDYAKLAERLRADGQVLESEGVVPTVWPSKLAGTVVDDMDAKRIGPWTAGSVTARFVGSVYLHDSNANKGKMSATYDLTVPEAGTYDVRVSYPPNPNRATNVPVTAKSSEGEISATINQKEAPPIDGLFLSIGRLAVGADKKVTVVLSNEGTNGYVLVDAVQLVPAD